MNSYKLTSLFLGCLLLTSASQASNYKYLEVDCGYRFQDKLKTLKWVFIPTYLEKDSKMPSLLDENNRWLIISTFPISKTNTAKLEKITDKVCNNTYSIKNITFQDDLEEEKGNPLGKEPLPLSGKISLKLVTSGGAEPKWELKYDYEYPEGNVALDDEKRLVKEINSYTGSGICSQREISSLELKHKNIKNTSASFGKNISTGYYLENKEFPYYERVLKTQTSDGFSDDSCQR